MFLKAHLFPYSTGLTKLLRVMKLIAFILLTTCLSVAASGYSQKVTISVKDAPLGKVFKEIKKQTGYVFFYEEASLQTAQKVTLQVKDFPLESALALCFKDQPLSFSIVGKTVVIKQNAAPSVVRVDKKPAPEKVADLPPVTGTVTSADGGPLQGATVTIKGTRISATTNEAGLFSINAEPGQTLVISYIGYQTIEEPVKGRSAVNVVLTKAVNEIEQVVITALGISKKARSLSYNTQEIKGDDISAVNNGNFVNSLNGKIAGATINSSSTGTGGSSRVILRGTKSIAGNNNALYVIDGIPMPTNDNNARGQASDIFSGAGQTGDFVANLNPDDIENISVLSGPSAAALYGSAAANGVIMITTKKGQKNRTDLSVSNATTFSNPFVLPEFQNTYGVSEVGSYYSWGDKLSTPSSYHPKDFFNTGVNTTSSLNFSTGNEKSQTYVSFGNVTASGIITNNDFDRSNFTARNSSNFMDGKLNLDINFMAGMVNERNMISQGQYFNPLMAVYLFPAGDDFNKVKAFERYNSSRNLMTQWWAYGDNGLMMQNPYWVTNRDIFGNKKERYMTTLALKYNINNWISISGRAKLDKSNEKNERKFAASTNTLFASDNGYYSLNSYDTRQIYAEALVNINKTIKDKYNVIANVGTVIEDVRNNQYMYGGKLQGVANLYTYANVNKATSEMSQRSEPKQKQSVLGSAQLGYKNMLYLDLSARNDWASTLAAVGGEDVSFFYSSVGLSGVITDLFKIKSDKLTYLKLRASYAEVGNEPPPFLTIPTYSLAGGFPVTQTRLPNPDLQPERTKSFEAGLNAVLFKGALKIDGTVYSSRTYNQFFEPTLSSASGYTSVIVNAGRIDNKGLEVSARYSKKFGALNWSSYATYSINRNKIVELLPGWTNPVTGEKVSLSQIDLTGTGSYKMVLKEGGSMGDIYVNTLRVDEHGAIYVDPGSQTVVQEPNKFIYAGNNNPKYNIGWGNTLNWKGINLNFLFNARVGGIVVSNTQAIMDAFGISKASADARDAGGAIVNGRPIPAKEYYSIVGGGASGGIASMYVYSATNVRLGEVTIGYDLPIKKWVKFVKGANISFVGRNLVMLYNKAPFDPELTANTQTFFQGIDYFMMPSLRSMGFSVKLNF